MDAQLVAFTGVAAGIVALPGADFTVVVRNALASRRAGVACAVGVVAGLLVHTALAVAGVAAVLTAVPALFGALQIVGGAMCCISPGAQCTPRHGRGRPRATSRWSGAAVCGRASSPTR